MAVDAQLKSIQNTLESSGRQIQAATAPQIIGFEIDRTDKNITDSKKSL